MDDVQLYIGQSIVPEFRLWRDGRILNVTGADLEVEITSPDLTTITYPLIVIDGEGGVLSLEDPITLSQVGVLRYWLSGSDANGNLISRPASSDYVFKHY